MLISIKEVAQYLYNMVIKTEHNYITILKFAFKYLNIYLLKFKLAIIQRLYVFCYVRAKHIYVYI